MYVPKKYSETSYLILAYVILLGLSFLNCHGPVGATVVFLRKVKFTVSFIRIVKETILCNYEIIILQQSN